MRSFPSAAARRLIDQALEEDLGARGDITTDAVLASRQVSGRLVSREPAIIAGLPSVGMVFDALAKQRRGSVAVTLRVDEGAEVAAGAELARLEGHARNMLAGERVMLNLLARLCGIATLTRAAVLEISGTSCRIADTRKTTPGLRALEKYAVAVGGGENHRSSLDELILIKDNHKQLAGGIDSALLAVREAGYALSDIEVEVESLAELEVALAFGCGWILLDNMDLESVREAARRARGRARLEVSGGLAPGRLRALAETGVDRLSMGYLTHSARAVDLALDVDASAGWHR
ncbi:MAG: carboxylating nicotinate-nucleotide diphosphorylase [Acidobacteriota bacterium]|nr:MAG: carboxylating nicotinate-nucleotide diphosphorylase [Acidobacteriota bacterium]